MPKALTITTFNDSPGGPAGECPSCGGVLRNPRMGEKSPLQVGWEVTCKGCGARVTVENGRVLARMGLSAPQEVRMRSRPHPVRKPSGRKVQNA